MKKHLFVSQQQIPTNLIPSPPNNQDNLLFRSLVKS